MLVQRDLSRYQVELQGHVRDEADFLDEQLLPACAFLPKLMKLQKAARRASEPPLNDFRCKLKIRLAAGTFQII